MAFFYVCLLYHIAGVREDYILMFRAEIYFCFTSLV
jgi:hypothetical protein